MKLALVMTFITTATTLPQAAPDTPNGKLEGDKAEVLKLQQGLVDAFSKGSKASAAYLEPLLGEEVVVTDQSAQTTGKAKVLEMAKKGDRGPLAMQQKNVKARVYGDTVVVTGLMAAKALPQEAFYFTIVYVRGQRNWQIVAMQLTPLRRR
jgi:hypothetical protein